MKNAQGRGKIGGIGEWKGVSWLNVLRELVHLLI